MNKEKRTRKPDFCSVSPSCLKCEHLNRRESYCEYFDDVVPVDNLISQSQKEAVEEYKQELKEKVEKLTRYKAVASGVWSETPIDGYFFAEDVLQIISDLGRRE